MGIKGWFKTLTYDPQYKFNMSIIDVLQRLNNQIGNNNKKIEELENTINIMRTYIYNPKEKTI